MVLTFSILTTFKRSQAEVTSKIINRLTMQHCKPSYNFDLSSWRILFWFCDKIICLSFLDFQRHMVGLIGGTHLNP